MQSQTGLHPFFLLERSAEVLALNSVFHSSLSRSGMLINRGWSFVAG